MEREKQVPQGLSAPEHTGPHHEKREPEVSGHSSINLFSAR